VGTPVGAGAEDQSEGGKGARRAITSHFETKGRRRLVGLCLCG
jgi:hypothetical protein